MLSGIERIKNEIIEYQNDIKAKGEIFENDKMEQKYDEKGWLRKSKSVFTVTRSKKSKSAKKLK